MIAFLLGLLAFLVGGLWCYLFGLGIKKFLSLPMTSNQYPPAILYGLFMSVVLFAFGLLCWGVGTAIREALKGLL